MKKPALGLIETVGLDGAIAATRAATEAGQVDIASAEKNQSGRITVAIEGDWSAVQAAVEAGARAADVRGELISMHVIPCTDNGLSRILPYRRFVDRYQPDRAAEERKSAIPQPVPRPSSTKPVPTVPPRPKLPPRPRPEKPTLEPIPAPETEPVSTIQPPGGPGIAELEKMSVVKLRRYARSVSGLPIQGRQISKANKQQLLDALRSVADRE